MGMCQGTVADCLRATLLPGLAWHGRRASWPSGAPAPAPCVT